VLGVTQVGASGVALLPGEFEPLDGILVSDYLCSESCYQQLATAIVNSGMKLFLASSSGSIPWNCRFAAQNSSNVVPVRGDQTSMWIRDYGPFVTAHSDGGFRIHDFHYPRGYNTRNDDDNFPGDVAPALCSYDQKYCNNYLDVPFESMLLEGGNLLPNGAGLCLVSDAVLCQTGITSYCRQNEESFALNPPYGKDMTWIRSHFASELGCTDLRVLQGYYGDEGLNHVDMFMTFASSHDLLLGKFGNEDPRNKAIYESNKASLQDLTASGLIIHDIPMPSQCRNSGSCADNPNRRLRTFLNGLFLPNSKQYIMPTYSISYGNYLQKEWQAIQVFTSLGWTVITQSGDDLIKMDGVFHCVTRNMPRWTAPATTSSTTAAPAPACYSTSGKPDSWCEVRCDDANGWCSSNGARRSLCLRKCSEGCACAEAAAAECISVSSKTDKWCRRRCDKPNKCGSSGKEQKCAKKCSNACYCRPGQSRRLHLNASLLV